MSIWRQFRLFCEERKYERVEETSTKKLASVLCNWAFNMKKNNGEDSRESAVKTIRNTSAKCYKRSTLMIINEFLIRSRTYSLRKREAPTIQNAKFYKQFQKTEGVF